MIFISGLGEVSENLLNDQNLTSEDFFDNQHISERDNTLHVQDNHAGSSNFLTKRKTDNRQEFKTPDASKHFQKIIETPCLFSQDESGSIFPSSGEDYIMFSAIHNSVILFRPLPSNIHCF